MVKNRSRDNKYFNCSEEHELRYVAGRYEEKGKVYKFLKESCANHGIYHSTHEEVYHLIESELGFTVAV